MRNTMFQTLVLFSSLFGFSFTVLAVPQPNAREAALNGVWQLAEPVANPLLSVGGKVPPLNEAGKVLYQQRRTLLEKGDSSFDLSLNCKPIGFPRALWDGSPFDIQVQNNLVFFGYTFNRNHRIVDFDEAPPEPQIPRYYGTSTAQWDGDTLVVQSAMYNTNTMLDASGLPISEELFIIERYRPFDEAKKLEVNLQLDDPTYYSAPWNVKLVFERVPNGRIKEDVCQERSEFYKDLL